MQETLCYVGGDVWATSVALVCSRNDYYRTEAVGFILLGELGVGGEDGLGK